MIVVGAGEAGVRAALALRAEGYGGAITLIGEETHAPYERPPLSKSTITTADEPKLTQIPRAAGLPAQNIAMLALCRVESIDVGARRLSLSDGRALTYDKLLLATGATARKLNLPGGEHALLLRNYEDSLALRAAFVPGRRVVIIGGGFIGLELAASARARGCAVTLLEAAPRILTRGVPQAIAERLTARHRAEGVDLRLGVSLARIEREDDGFNVVLADGESFAADCVVAGIGAAPQIALAAQAGLRLDNGVAVDGALRTSDPNIFAAGDCASFPHPLFGGVRMRLEAWRSAQDQGFFAARAMLGHGGEFAATPWFWSDQYDWCLQIAGVADFGPVSVERDLGDGALAMFHLTADGRLVGAGAVGPLSKVAKEIRPAEMLIARSARPSPEALRDPQVKLKSLLEA